MKDSKAEDEAIKESRSSSPLSSMHEPELPDTSADSAASAAQLPPVEDIKLSSPPAEKESPKVKAPKPTKKKVVVKRAARRSKWNAENILSDPKSPLASAELRTVLTNPMAWDVLDAAEKAEILALFPDKTHILSAETEDARPDFASLRNDDSFRYDCAAYTENLAQGRHDPEWLASAWSAHERRKVGEFDEHLENKFKEDWEVELPPEFRSHRGAAAPSEDTKMEDAKPLQTDDETKENNGADELQVGEVEQEYKEAEHKTTTVAQLLNTRKSTEGEKSEDELA